MLLLWASGIRRCAPHFKDLTAARIRLQQVGGACLNTRALVQERQRTSRYRDTIGNAFAVFGGLNLDTGESFAFLLGLNYASCCAIYEEEVVGLAVPLPHGKFANSDLSASRDVGGIAVLDYPTSGCQKLIDLLTCLVL